MCIALKSVLLGLETNLSFMPLNTWRFPMNYLRSEPPGYLKALKDFNVLELTQKLAELTQGECDSDDLKILTALLVKHLTNLLSSDWLLPYCHALRRNKADVVEKVLSVNLTLPLSPDSVSFFLDAEPPTFSFGVMVRWFPLDNLIPPDFGIVIGRFYGYIPERMQWSWCYVILLDPNCPSARWCSVDTGWESDLEICQNE